MNTLTHPVTSPVAVTPSVAVTTAAATPRIQRRTRLAMRWSAAEPTRSRTSRDDMRLRWILERGPIR